jgi:poly(3-hydroxybutyrate) depolymerase
VTKRRGDPWQTPLTRAIELRDGTRLTTLAEARAFMVALPEGDQLRNAWQKAAELLMVAAESGDTAAVTRQIEFALFVQAKWKLPR